MAKAAKGKAEGAALHWRVVAIAVFIVAFAAVVVTLDDPGLTWDEPFSIVSGHWYARWLGQLPRFPFDRASLDRHWQHNHEHPPLAKLLMGLSQAAFARGRADVAASRLAVALVFALTVEMVFRFGGRAFGGLAGVLSSASLLCMPRVFGHAHLATLDVTMAATWLLSVVVFARAVGAGGWRWGLVSGVCFGLALLTKVNAVFLPLALAGWGIGFHRKRALVPLAWTLGVGVAVFFAGWPWLWPAPLSRAWAFVRPTWRVAIPVEYFGRVYEGAPFHYPIVMTLTTMPVGILFLVVVGGARAIRRLKGSPMLALVAVNVAVAIGPFLLPWLPKYDGVRLWLPAFPFLALLAGVGGARCWVWVAERSRKRPWRPLFVTAVFFLLQAGAVVWMRPCYLSYYNALVGGLWGAEKLGLETTYWHDVVDRRLFRWLNRRCPGGDVIAFYPVGEYVTRTSPGEGDFYEAFYLDARKGLRAVRLEKGVRPQFVVLNARTAMLRRHEAAWALFTTGRPVYAVRKQGVLLAAVYEMR